MRFYCNVQVIVSEDGDQTNNLVPDLTTVIDDSTPTHKRVGTFDIAANAAEAQYLFSPEVTNGKYIMLLVLAGTVTIKQNLNTAPAIGLTVDPAAASDPVLPYQVTPQPGVYVIGPVTLANPLTSLWIHNTSTTLPARVSVAIVGEAV